MDKINEKLGTDYKPFNYYGAPDAEYVIISMGSSCDALMEVCDYLNSTGKKVGMVNVHLYRPFAANYLIDVLPDTVKGIAVLDRCKEPGALGEPLYLDVVIGAQRHQIRLCPRHWRSLWPGFQGCGHRLPDLRLLEPDVRASPSALYAGYHR